MRTLVLVAAVAFVGACNSSSADLCSVGPAKYPLGAVNPQDPCQTCQPGPAKSLWATADAGFPCGNGGVCYNGTCQRGCYVTPNFYPDGTLDPHRTCQRCQPDIDTTQFTQIAGAAPPGQCAFGQVCLDGACATACLIDGQIQQTGQPDTTNQCLTCQPLSAPDRFSAVTDGTICADGGFACVSGFCRESCVIDGTVLAAGDRAPGNPCLVCDPIESFRTWTALAGPAPGCGAGEVCASGACSQGCLIDGGFVPASLVDPSGACRVCDPGRTTVDWSTFSGIPPGGCAGGQVCDQGLCRVGCSIDGGYAADRAPLPTDVAFCCNAGANPGAWSASFAPSISYSLLVASSEVIPGDFNGDGLIDLAVGGCSGSSLLSIFFSKRTGLRPELLALDASCTTNLTSGDLNQDGVSDLAFLNTQTGKVGVVLSQADGGFGSELSLPPALPPKQVGVADVNLDGLPDILVLEWDATYNASSLEVFLGSGQGAFGDGTNYTVGPTGGAMVIADLNSDGAPDVAVTGFGGTFTQLAVVLNDGRGHFGGVQTMGLVSTPSAVVAGDFNGDGKMDLVVDLAGVHLELLAGNGQGGFQAGVTQAAYAPVGRMIARDLNGDGSLDLLLVSSGTTQGPYLAINDGKGNFLGPKQVGPPPPAAGSLWMSSAAVGDFNGDGALDLALLLLTNGGVGYSSGSTAVSIWLNGCP